ncbi:alkaline phosphatase PhoX [Halovenus rubra]|uniref:Alkaline phosphatase PhoX n=2 Tax=Halovenus rubra TaxID=869890 RepID=A0ABD5X5I3_9EURY|nr:alkaline phosphatase PhoX [Halovenus rubra]
MQVSVAAAVGAGATGATTAQKDRSGRETDDDDTLTAQAPTVVGDIKRFSTTAFGAEMTGPFVFNDGTLLHSVQHPSRENPDPWDKAGVGYYKDFQFDFDGGNEDFTEPSPPEGTEQDYPRAANIEFEYLITEGEPINGGTERWGITQTPEGRDVTADSFAGTTYGESGYNPDANHFVSTNEEETKGFLFTNDENSPGNVMRTPVERTDDGKWEADADNAINTVNTTQFRKLGGTRINCYGDLSPWETPISSEEHYGHPRVGFTQTISDIEEAGTGAGLSAAAHFWNRPNPVTIQDAVNAYDEVDSWYVQGYWNLVGVEHLAYYLGAETVQAGDDNPRTPINEAYPNPYRYGYHVEIQDPAAPADEITPVKHYVMGRAAWEAPDLLPDEQTVYGCSDGDSKGVYKFVADEPIPSYDDPMDVAGTLYAISVTNEEASSGKSPAEVPLEVEWIKLGHASNQEVESWITEYDDVTQVDYLESHTDWSEGDDVTEEVLKQADLTVIEDGNQDYIPREAVLEWARQWEENGPDGVDEELRKIPFLETRAAAKEAGASIEFNKAEGVDSADGAKPGDYIYFGISEFNDNLAGPTNDGGDIALERVDGGVVYRAELESDYNVSRFEPIIVGPDFTKEEAMADVDNSLRNVDNVYAMRDGRVLCCEDGWRGGNRSYPNDGMYVYQPPQPDGSDGSASQEKQESSDSSDTDDSSDSSDTDDSSEADSATGNNSSETDTESDNSSEEPTDSSGDSDDDSESTTSNDKTESSDDDGAGFGIGGGVAGVAGVGYLLKNRFSDKVDDKPEQ